MIESRAKEESGGDDASGGHATDLDEDRPVILNQGWKKKSKMMYDFVSTQLHL